MKKAKIIATIGPACKTLTMVEKMAKAGVDVCRLNFSFGTEKQHLQMLGTIRKASKKVGKPLAVLQDLQGPKIRVGKLSAPVEIKKNDTLFLSGNTAHKEEFCIPTTYSKIAGDTKVGKTILMADGKIILKVTAVDKAKKLVRCKVINGGTILTGKGINLPYTNISLPALTKKDREDAIFGAHAGVDYMALSFVRTAEDVLKLRRLLKKEKKDIPIIAKLEKPEAIDNLDEILDVVDGVMVARGDLAVELSFAKVPSAQKYILHKANKRGLITIIATEMLSSMVENPLPTRAEASDVANGVLDGSDSVMLSNETATGKYPVKAVSAMTEIIEEIESSPLVEDYYRELDLPESHELTESMCMAAAHLSYSLNERAVVVLTENGDAARILSKYRPQSTIYAATFDEAVYQRMSFYHNVTPVLLLDKEEFLSEENINKAYKMFEEHLKKIKLAQKGDKLIILTGITSFRKANFHSIHVVNVD